MKKIFSIIFTVIIAILILTTFCFGQGEKDEKTIYIKIGSGPAGSMSYSACAKVSELIKNNIPNAAISVIPGGNVVNARLVATKELDMGWTTVNCAYFAYEGIDPYEKSHENLRFLASCDTSIMQLAVPKNSDINSYKDLYNKRINPQRFGSNTRLSAEVLLNLYGITFENIKKNGGVVHSLSTGDAASMMQDGKLDGMFAFGCYLPAFLTVAERPGIKLISLPPEIIEKAVNHPKLRGSFEVKLPSGVYKDSGDVMSIGIQKIFVVRDNMPSDLAYKICKIIYEDKGLKNFYKGAIEKGFPQAFTVENAEKGAVIPIHQGANKYIKEQGY